MPNSSLKKVVLKFKYPLIVVIIISCWFGYSIIKQKIALQTVSQSSSGAREISKDEFSKIVSESAFFENNNKAFPELIRSYGGDSYYYLFDLVTNTYYKYSEFAGPLTETAESYPLPVSKFPAEVFDYPGMNLIELELPRDDRFTLNGGMACFSCGCSCYADGVFLVANDTFFVIASGLEKAMSLENQGVYMLTPKANSWKHIIPKIDIGSGGFNSVEKEMESINPPFKIIDKGCTAVYKLNDKFYSLNICTTKL